MSGIVILLLGIFLVLIVFYLKSQGASLIDAITIVLFYIFLIWFFLTQFPLSEGNNFF